MNKSKVKSKATLDEPAWWLKPLTEPQAELATDSAGLSNAEAHSRLAKFGHNLFRDHQEQPLFRIYFKNHGKYKIYRNILTESQIKQTLSHLEYPRLTG